jgi:hypothetical protein
LPGISLPNAELELGDPRPVPEWSRAELELGDPRPVPEWSRAELELGDPRPVPEMVGGCHGSQFMLYLYSLQLGIGKSSATAGHAKSERRTGSVGKSVGKFRGVIKKFLK